MTVSVHPEQIELRADPITRHTIDVNDGIERVMGKRDLYARMLRRFKSDQARGIGPIAAALAEREIELALRMVVSLKGTSGMIGAHRLHQHASILEEALRLKKDSAAVMQALAHEFDRVLEVLDLLLEGRPAEGEAIQAVRPLLGHAALLRRLKELLAQGDGAAIDILNESAPSLRVMLGDQRLLRVSEAARTFRYREALQALEESELS